MVCVTEGVLSTFRTAQSSVSAGGAITSRPTALALTNPYRTANASTSASARVALASMAHRLTGSAQEQTVACF